MNINDELSYWVGLLSLKDWRIALELVDDLRDPNGNPVWGLCWAMVDGKRAKIQLRTAPIPGADEVPGLDDVLVHELVHLHFAPLSDSTASGIKLEEQGVWALSDALASLKKGFRGMAKRRDAALAVRCYTVQERNSAMDMPALIAALATLASMDPDACQTGLTELVSQLKAGSPDAGPPSGTGEPPMAADAPQQPPQAPQAPVAADCGPQPPPKGRAPTTRSALADGGELASIKRDLEAMRVDQYLDRNAAHLSATQRAFAGRLTLAGAQQYLAAHPAATAPTSGGQAPQSAATTPSARPLPGARRQAPTMGTPSHARSAEAGSATERDLAEVDRRMGVRAAPIQAIGRDPAGRLTISNLGVVPKVD